MRQFVIDKEPDSKGMIYLFAKDYKYIRQILRLNIGDFVKVVFKDKTFDTTLCAIDDNKKKITLQICNSQENLQTENSSSKIEFWLLQFVPKPQKMELIVRQATENGTKKILPVFSEFLQKGSENIFEKKSERLEKIIREARQQSGSPIQTEIFEPHSLKDAIKLVCKKEEEIQKQNKACIKIALYERNQNSVTIHQAVSDCACQKEIGFAVVAVGCEGGISPSEINLLKDAGFSTVHFDVNILRCETASLYGMAALQTTVLEYKKWQLKE